MENNTINNEFIDYENLPAQQTKKKLKELSEEFKPTDVKFMVSLDKNVSLEECEEEAKNMLIRLQKYINNGHKNCEGTNFEVDMVI